MTVHSTEPRLVPTGPTTAIEADWSKALCVFCLRPLAKGDLTKCHWHKAVSQSLIDAGRATRVLICGSRSWTDSDAISRAVNALPNGAVVIHGAARGADRLADQAARSRGLEREPFPADWTAHGKAAGPIRNQQMLDEGKPDRVIAFRMPGASVGTDDMIRRARKAGITVEVIEA